MSDYKLVPVEPTPEMVEAAADAHMPFGDMDLALRMALLAAPAAQCEPVGEVRFEFGAPSVVYGELYSEAAPHLVPGTLLYAAPQPAERQPAPDVASDAGARNYARQKALELNTNLAAQQMDARAEFEAWITAPPYENPVTINPDSSAWPGQYQSYEVQLAWEAYQAGRAESTLLRAAIRRLCNIYVVDDYYMGQLREERLDAAVNRAIEQVKEINHDNQ